MRVEKSGEWPCDECVNQRSGVAPRAVVRLLQGEEVLAYLCADCVEVLRQDLAEALVGNTGPDTVRVWKVKSVRRLQ